jgi:hypothetical protein
MTIAPPHASSHSVPSRSQIRSPDPRTATGSVRPGEAVSE